MIKEYTPTHPTRTFPSNCPTSGQFVVIWEYDNKIWSDTYKRVGNNLYIYNHSDNDFVIIPDGSSYPWLGADTTTAKFYAQFED